MAFGESTVIDRLWAADALREPLSLAPDDVSDLIRDLPDEDDVMDRWIERLTVVDVKTLRMPVNARRAIEAALGLDEGGLWP